jgi:hypothetical protein
MNRVETKTSEIKQNKRMHRMIRSYLRRNTPMAPLTQEDAATMFTSIAKHLEMNKDSAIKEAARISLKARLTEWRSIGERWSAKPENVLGKVDEAQLAIKRSQLSRPLEIAARIKRRGCHF